MKSEEKRFYVDANLLKAYTQNGKRYVVTRSSNTLYDTKGDGLEREALEEASSAAVRSRAPLLETHWSTFPIGLCVKANVVFNPTKNSFEWFQHFELDERNPFADILYNETIEGKNDRLLSVGGHISHQKPGAVQHVFENGQMRRRVRHFRYDHTCTARPAFAVNKDTGFVEAIMKTLTDGEDSKMDSLAIFSGPSDKKLPKNVRQMTKKQRTIWVNVWNSSFRSCEAKRKKGGGSYTDSRGTKRSSAKDCEALAFASANGVAKKSKSNSAIAGFVFGVEAALASESEITFEQRCKGISDLLESSGFDVDQFPESLRPLVQKHAAALLSTHGNATTANSVVSSESSAGTITDNANTGEWTDKTQGEVLTSFYSELGLAVLHSEEDDSATQRGDEGISMADNAKKTAPSNAAGSAGTDNAVVDSKTQESATGILSNFVQGLRSLGILKEAESSTVLLSAKPDDGEGEGEASDADETGTEEGGSEGEGSGTEGGEETPGAEDKNGEGEETGEESGEGEGEEGSSDGESDGSEEGSGSESAGASATKSSKTPTNPLAAMASDGTDMAKQILVGMLGALSSEELRKTFTPDENKGVELFMKTLTATAAEAVREGLKSELGGKASASDVANLKKSVDKIGARLDRVATLSGVSANVDTEENNGSGGDRDPGSFEGLFAGVTTQITPGRSGEPADAQ